MMTTSTSSATLASIRPAVKRNRSNKSPSKAIKLNKTSNSGSISASQMDSTTNSICCSIKNAAIMSKQATIKATKSQLMRKHLLFEESDSSNFSTNANEPSGKQKISSSSSSSSSSGVATSTGGEGANSLSSNQSTDRDLEALEQRAAVASLKTATASSAKSTPLKNKFDPLNVLREIYFDSNSKVTMLSDGSDQSTVQKFHPNGRYGRRSVNNFAEPRAELGKLMLDDQLDSSLMSNDIPSASADRGVSLSVLMRGIHRDRNHAHLNSNNQQQAAHQLQQLLQKRHMTGEAANKQDDAGDMFEVNGARVADYQLEMSKLLKCNFSGIPNLYWCDPTTSTSGSSSS